MKKNILFLLLSLIVSAQKVQYIELKNNINDKKNLAGALTLIDKREDHNIGTVSHRNIPYEVKFEKDNLEELFSDWFSKENKIKGTVQYFLMLESLKVKDIAADNPIPGNLEMKVSTFFKRNNRFHFLKRVTISKNYRQRDDAYIPKVIAAQIASEITRIIKNSYEETGLGIPIAPADLDNYEKIVSGHLPVYTTDSLKDGVYTDYKSFAEQQPSKDLTVRKNKEGIIKGVGRVDDYDNTKETFAIIDNGIPYKKTLTSFIEIEKDEKGYFITASEEELFAENKTTMLIGAGIAGGAIGGLVVAVIDMTASKIRKQNAKYFRVGIDTLTGEYILPKNFRRSR